VLVSADYKEVILAKNHRNALLAVSAHSKGFTDGRQESARANCKFAPSRGAAVLRPYNEKSGVLFRMGQNRWRGGEERGNTQAG